MMQEPRAVVAAVPVALSGVAHSLLRLLHRSPEQTGTWLGPCRSKSWPPAWQDQPLCVPALQLSSLPCTWPGKALSQGGERAFVGKHFHFFHPLEDAGEQVALTHSSPFLPRVLPSLFASIQRLNLFWAPSHSLHTPCSQVMT